MINHRLNTAKIDLIILQYKICERNYFKILKIKTAVSSGTD